MGKDHSSSTVVGSPQSPKLKTGIVLKTSFKIRVSRMGLGIFVNINIFAMKYYFFSLFIFSIFFESLKSKSYTNVKTQKRKLGPTISFTFRALCSVHIVYTDVTVK